MIQFFGKRENDEIDLPELRIRSLERKVNLVLVIVVAQLLLSIAVLVKDSLLPSKITIAVAVVLSIGLIWLFRKPILGLIKRRVLTSMLDDDAPKERPPTARGTDDSIR